MTEELKKLIATAERKESGKYRDFLITSMGETYSDYGLAKRETALITC